jgi:hypothetical protein
LLTVRTGVHAKASGLDPEAIYTRSPSAYGDCSHTRINPERERVTDVMVPQPTRRQYLGSLSLTAIAALAGCTDSSGDGDDPSSQNTTVPTTDASTTEEPAPSTTDGSATEEPSTDEETTEASSDPPAADSPEAALRRYVETAVEDPAASRYYFHPIHPFGPEKLSASQAEELFSDATQPQGFSLETSDPNLSAEAILQQSILRSADLKSSDVAAAIEGEQTALVEGEVTQADGESESNSVVTVTHAGGWVILAQAFQPSGDTAPPKSFETRVVDEVTFDTDADTARVEFVDDPVADEVTAKADVRYSERSSDTPKPIDYLPLQVDPEGDTVIVTATVDGETREVHRERYPPSDRIVDDIEFDDDPERDDREMVARVLFNDDQEDQGVTAAATISGSEATFDSISGVNYVNVGVNPSGDEVVVSRTADGESTVIHRERYYP